MTKAICEIATASASRYLQQLCKHFAHEIPVSFDATAGRIDFPMGAVDLAATADHLTITVAPVEAEKLADLEDVVVRHLVRFAFRETLECVWQTVDAPAAPEA